MGKSIFSVKAWFASEASYTVNGEPAITRPSLLHFIARTPTLQSIWGTSTIGKDFVATSISASLCRRGEANDALMPDRRARGKTFTVYTLPVCVAWMWDEVAFKIDNQLKALLPQARLLMVKRMKKKDGSFVARLGRNNNMIGSWPRSSEDIYIYIYILT